MTDWSLPSEFGKIRKPIELVAVNRVPAGFTVYPIGCADGVATSPGYRNGPELKWSYGSLTSRFQMLGHWYGIGGRVFWEGADLDDYISATLKAPATVGVNTAGDFDKVATGLGFNIYVPAAPGAGAWTLDLAEKHTSTQVLKCVPVPSAGGNGYFDYDSDANALTVNAGAGNYNLFDAEIPLFCFAHKCWGKKQDGAESSLEIPDVVGKLLFNSWVIDFTLTTAKTSGIKVGGVMIVAVKGNV